MHQEKHYERVFKTLYCTICDNLNRFYGKKGILLNNFDATFLALYLVDLEKLETRNVKCLNPLSLKKIQILSQPNDVFEKLADLNVFAMNIALVDSAIDRQNIRNIIFKSIFGKVFELNLKRVADKVSDFNQKMSVIFNLLCKEESIMNVYSLADYNAKIAKELFKNDVIENIVKNIIVVQYLLDAFEDYHSDLKRSLKNPLFIYDKSYVPNIVQQLLEKSLDELSDLAKDSPNKQIIDIILYGSILGKFKYVKEVRWCERNLLRHTWCEARRFL